jgi:hypothetical protein
MEFKQYQMGDLPTLVQHKELKLLAGDTHVNPDLAWSLFDNSLLACGGFLAMWPGVYEAWLFVDTHNTFVSYKVCLIKKFRNEIAKLNFHRLQATVDEHVYNHHKFMKLLGFSAEGLLRQYGPEKNDYIMYSQVK